MERTWKGSTSAPNMIKLTKDQSASHKQKKRISFGADEVRIMDASPGIKSRLGFGRDRKSTRLNSSH